MYIKKVEIKNIRSIEHFSMTFQKNAAGWHVLIGDNGSGKSTILKAICLALVGPPEYHSLIGQNWDSWLRKGNEEGDIALVVLADPKVDKNLSGQSYETKYEVKPKLVLKKSRINGRTGQVEIHDNITIGQEFNPGDHIWTNAKGWLALAYGPFRRFSGGEEIWRDIARKNPSLARHLSVFVEGFVFSDCIDWLVKLKHRELERPGQSSIIDGLKRLINEGGLLPFKAQLKEITSEGVFFEDANGAIVTISELSDGNRSILTLALDIIRQIIAVYGEEMVLKEMNSQKQSIGLPGVVLVDEIDAHLHPTWQARIGQWFLKYFPKIQFIVTTHSPIICRAAKKGSIWRLSAPGSEEPSRKITGPERDRLVFGNVLEALGTEAFGSKVSRSQESTEKLERLAELNMLHSLGKISSEEKREMEKLRKIFTTDDQTEF